MRCSIYQVELLGGEFIWDLMFYGRPDHRTRKPLGWENDALRATPVLERVWAKLQHIWLIRQEDILNF